jgi:hypothetical protein
MFRSALPDAIRCQIFSYLDIARLGYQQATKSEIKNSSPKIVRKLRFDGGTNRAGDEPAATAKH